MIHADDKDRVCRAALNQLRALLEGDGSGGAGGGYGLTRTARAVFRREIFREQLGLEMAASAFGAGTAVREAFECFDVRLCGGKNEADALG